MLTGRSDLLKIRNALDAAVKFHEKRDEMNSFLHLGKVCYSPLTSKLQTELERLRLLLLP